jgi:peptide/nickel transport system ATP-binding protein
VVERLSDRVAIMYLGRIVETAPARELFAHPTHPYTRILLAAAPRLNGRRATDHIAVRGDPPSAAAIHAGCAFADRCPLVEPVCRGTVPRLTDTALAHRVACHVSTVESAAIVQTASVDAVRRAS